MRSILFVDPAVSFRSEVRHVLTVQGYHVRTAQDAMEAIAWMDALGSALHIVVTELCLPDSDGVRLVHRIIARRPATKALICSSRCDGVWFLDPAIAAGVGFLEKPFKTSQLLAAVRDLMQPAIIRPSVTPAALDAPAAPGGRSCIGS